MSSKRRLSDFYSKRMKISKGNEVGSSIADAFDSPPQNQDNEAIDLTLCESNSEEPAVMQIIHKAKASMGVSRKDGSSRIFRPKLSMRNPNSSGVDLSSTNIHKVDLSSTNIHNKRGRVHILSQPLRKQSTTLNLDVSVDIHKADTGGDTGGGILGGSLRRHNFNPSMRSSLPKPASDKPSSSSSLQLRPSLYSSPFFSSSSLSTSSSNTRPQTTIADTAKVRSSSTSTAVIPKLSTKPFFISLEKSNKNTSDDVIFQGEDHSGPKVYPLTTTGDSHSSESTPSLQRKPLSHNRQLSYDEMLSCAEKNTNSDKRAKLSLPKKNPSYAGTVIRYGKVTAPSLKNNAVVDRTESQTIDLNQAQIGLLLIKSPRLEIDSLCMKLSFEYENISADIDIEYRSIEECKQYDMRILLLKLRPGLIRTLISRLSTRLRIQSGFLKVTKPFTPESTIKLSFSEKVPKVKQVINGLKLMSYSGLQCTVSDVSKEEMDELLALTEPTEEPIRRFVPRLFSAYDEDPISEPAPKSDNLKSFYEPELPLSQKTTEPSRIFSLSKSKPESPSPDHAHVPQRRSLRISSQESEEPRVKKPNVMLLQYKPKGCKVGVEIMTMDVETLEPGEYLNDKVMDFYLKYMMYEMLEEELQPKLHIFSSFFYTRLSNASMDNKSLNLSTPELIHSRVKTWTRHIDLFSKDYIVIPVCDRAHWYVVFICYPGKFDPSKVAPSVPRRSRGGASSKRKRKKPVRRDTQKGNKETQSGIVNLCSKEGSSDSEVNGEDEEEEENEDPLSDPLHLNVYMDSDDEEKVGTKKKCDIPGKKIAEVSTNIMLTSQNQEVSTNSLADQPVLAVAETPPHDNQDSDHFSCLGRSTVQDPGVTMWLGGESSSSTDDHGSIDENITKSPDMDYFEVDTKPDHLHDHCLDLHDHCLGGGGGGGDEIMESVNQSSSLEENCGSLEELTAMEYEDEEPKIKEEDEEDSQPSCILVLDSLGVRRPTAVKRVRNYLTEEWKIRKKEACGMERSFENLPMKYPRIPLQNNSSDCGIFVLQYVETIVMCLKEKRPLPMHSDGWGTYQSIKEKRKKIDTLINAKIT